MLPATRANIYKLYLKIIHFKKNNNKYMHLDWSDGIYTTYCVLLHIGSNTFSHI